VKYLHGNVIGIIFTAEGRQWCWPQMQTTMKKVSDFKVGDIVKLEKTSKFTGGSDKSKILKKEIIKIENGSIYLKGSKCRFVLDGGFDLVLQGITSNGNWSVAYKVVEDTNSPT